MKLWVPITAVALAIHKTRFFIIFLETGGANAFLSDCTFKTKRKNLSGEGELEKAH